MNASQDAPPFAVLGMPRPGLFDKVASRSERLHEGIADRARAVRICQNLRSQGIDCRVVDSRGRRVYPLPLNGEKGAPS